MSESNSTDAMPTVIHPALDFTLEHAYVGQNLPCRRTFNGQDTMLYIISDGRTKIVAEEWDLQRNGLRLKYAGFELEPRWSLESITTYLERGPAVSPAALFGEIRTTFETYIELSDARLYDLLSLWTIGTYFFPLFNSYPYVYVGGISGSGKTKLLSVCEALSFNGVSSGSMSAAAVYRFVQNERCSLFFDETEMLACNSVGGEFRILLLGGYRKGLNVIRNRRRDDDWVPRRFEVYSPKMLANITGIEPVLESRCISIVMRAGLNREITDTEVDLSDPAWQNKRDSLYPFLMANWKAVKIAYLGIQNTLAFAGRHWELWKPILALATFFSESTLATMQELAVEKTSEAQSFARDNLEVVLGETLLALVRSDGYYKLFRIRNQLARRLDDANWLSCRQLGQLLRNLGFSNRRRVGDGTEYLLRVSEVRTVARRLGLLSEGGEGSEGPGDNATESEDREEGTS